MEEEKLFYITVGNRSIDIADADDPPMLMDSPIISIMTAKMRNILLLHWAGITDELSLVMDSYPKNQAPDMVSCNCNQVTIGLDMNYIYDHIRFAKKITESDLKTLLTFFDYTHYFRPLDDFMELIHKHAYDISLYHELNTEENELCLMRGLLTKNLKEKE